MRTNFIDTYKIEDLALINMKKYNSIIDGDNIDLFDNVSNEINAKYPQWIYKE